MTVRHVVAACLLLAVLTGGFVYGVINVIADDTQPDF
jgi:hypothetical protein